MNIKITIKDAHTQPLIHNNELSEVEFKKKKSLYQQPERDKNNNKQQKTVNQNKASRQEKSLRQTGLRSSGQEQARIKGEKKLMQDLDKMSKNQASLEMVHNSNNILQKQNEILYENQKVIKEMVQKTNEKPNSTKNEGVQIQGVLANIKRQVQEMKKIKEEIQRAGRQFIKTMSEAKITGKQNNIPSPPNNIAQMNSNLKNLAEISKNQIEGLQNVEAIKNLQNFNIQSYTQAINGLKRQIMQYQKQSEQIERQIKLRAAKLDKIQVKPSFDADSLAPYEEYLKKKAQSIDMHLLKEKVYEKLGNFDYGKFQLDVSQIMGKAKGQIKEFQMILTQFKINPPDFRIDNKELKSLDLKLVSAIDQYKAERGINFADPKSQQSSNQLEDSRLKKNKRSGEAIFYANKTNEMKKKTQKFPPAFKQANTKPIDYSTQVKFQKTNEPNQKTILETNKQRSKKEVQQNFKKAKTNKNQDQEFEKYLEYRAKDELQQLYRQKQQKLKKMKNELLETCKEEPEVYLHLNLRNEILKQQSPSKKKEEQRANNRKKEIEQRQKEEEQSYEQIKPIHQNEAAVIKSIGTEVLKQKLKNILGQANSNRRQQHNPQNNPYSHPQEYSRPEPRIQNVAENFLSLINNTLTQVNTQISQTIQHKFEQRSLSKQKKEYQRKSPAKMVIPRLQQFRAPPVFNMPASYPQQAMKSHPTQPTLPKPMLQAKIVAKNYEHLQIKNESNNYADLQISQDSYKQDFQ